MPDEQQLSDDERSAVQTACLYHLTSGKLIEHGSDSDHALLLSALRKLSGVDKVVVVRRV